ncbi:DNA (cytosine-5-)-methyltransferase [Streptococcus suis]|uniref:DNA (cytosine-5-)-methyltransferase n=1 Tax=Streptococcus suis TaxID=1307 RepID=UPI000CF51481|nr:DNA (cytosine-5-)-methyltransferase [Streptococcus suis]NRG98405.1 DNA (cytosine-5-)-methyltransferase [Streptococcus suis]
MIETFSGIGSQSQALKNLGVDYEVVATAEWDINALYAYDIIHNGKQDLKDLRHHTKESLIKELMKFNISSNGKSPLTEKSLRSMPIIQLKSIYAAIIRNNNLVDISEVHSQDLPDADILTYSFPCQDLSVSGHWHNNTGGIDRDAQNRSTLLWQIERILKEYEASGKELPKFLLMENVSNILSKRHIDNFREWQAFLEDLNYVNQVYTLDARDFGVPQTRKRTFMISVLANNLENKKAIEDYFSQNNLENYKSKAMHKLDKYLKLDYSQEKYRLEAIDSTPMLTDSREKIFEQNIILAEGDKVFNNLYAKTVTTKQDRHPNSGLVAYSAEVILTDKNKKYRNLTPRECFLLMGFDESHFDALMENNFISKGNQKFLSTSKLVKMAGNSIVVPILEKIFEQMIDIQQIDMRL